MSQREIKNYHHGDLKPALIKAGLELLEEKGLERLSLRAIATHVGVSHTAPNNHFDGLRGLLTAIAAEGFQQHASTMRHHLKDASAGVESVYAAGLGYVSFAIEKPELFKLMFSGALCNPDDETLHHAALESQAILAEVARRVEWGELRHPPGRVEVMLWSLVHGYSTLLISRQLPEHDHDTAKREIKELLKACLP